MVQQLCIHILHSPRVRLILILHLPRDNNLVTKRGSDLLKGLLLRFPVFISLAHIPRCKATYGK